jgi:hypothetical protein
MKTDFVGRVENLQLSKRQPLQALFEAVSNSLQSVAENGTSNGLIRVELERDRTQSSLALAKDGQEVRALEEIKTIRIIDNGNGFTDKNYESFETLDSRLKARIGGKGVGRLVWLKVFREASIESVYPVGDGKYRRRKVTFKLPHGAEQIADEAFDSAAPTTTVTLSGPLPDFSKHLRYKASTIRDEIVRHFLSQLLSNNPPTIEVVEGADKHQISKIDLPNRPVKNCPK